MYISDIKNLLITLCTTLLLFGCSRQRLDEKADVIVSIPPLKYIIEQITDNNLKVEILLPSGAGPETYELTPRQYIALNQAKLVFTTGLIPFEQSMVGDMKIPDRVINLSKGIDLIEGSCTHDHAHHHDGHHHGIDPHIWTSPRELKIMARNAYDAIIKEYPDSTQYSAAYNKLMERLSELDHDCQAMCAESSAKAFVIYHPAFSYFARAYGIEQIAIENEGKEPSVKYIANIIERAREKNVRALLFQTQYPRSVAEVIAKDMGLKAYEIDPLAENIIENICHIAQIITNQPQ